MGVVMGGASWRGGVCIRLMWLSMCASNGGVMLQVYIYYSNPRFISGCYGNLSCGGTKLKPHYDLKCGLNNCSL